MGPIVSDDLVPPPHLMKTVCTSCTAIVTMALENVIVKGDIIRPMGRVDKN